MATDAIHPDAPTPGEGGQEEEIQVPLKTVAEDRLGALESVATRHMLQQQEEEGVDFGIEKPKEPGVDDIDEERASDPAPKPAQKQEEEEEEPSPTPAAKPKAKEEEEEEEPTPAPKAKEEEEEDEPPLSNLDYDVLDDEAASKTRIPVKIDGEIQYLTIDQVKRGFQKDSAASKRLEQAAHRARELDEREQRLKEREQQLDSGGAKDVDLDPTKQGQPSSDLEAAAQSFIDAMYSGDEEESKKALATLLGGREQATRQDVDLDALTAQVRSDVSKQLKVESVMQEFSARFSDVTSDPHLSRVADDFLVQIQEDDPDMPLDKALRLAGNRTRAWVRRQSGTTTKETPTPTAETTREEKKDLKRNMDNLASAGTKAEGEPEEPEETESDVIQQMMRDRELAKTPPGHRR